MYTLQVENDIGDTLALTGNPNYTVYRIDGLTPPKATINSSVNTTTDGSKISSVRLENRNIVLYLTIEREVEKNRIELYKHLPVKRTVTLHYKNNTRNVCIKGVVESNEPAIFDQKQVAQISIICEKPYFKEINELVTMFGDVLPLFEFPFSIPAEGIEFSRITKNTRKSILNTGDVETGLLIELFATGTVVNPVIFDTYNRTQMALKISMQAGDKLVINTNIGEKGITLIRDGEESNALGYMRPDSSWFVLMPGDNVFTYDCESGASNLQLTFKSSILYAGV
jgi:hypothetical protein